MLLDCLKVLAAQDKQTSFTINVFLLMSSSSQFYNILSKKTIGKNILCNINNIQLRNTLIYWNILRLISKKKVKSY
jgi:hypothetical protein